MGSKFRSWCFTINNYTEEEYETIIINYNEYCYCIVGKEIGKQGTKHLQGYVYFKNRRYLEGVKNIIGERAHLEVSRGTPSDNRHYCSKDKHFAEYGELPTQGSRTDLIKIKKNILEERKQIGDIIKSELISNYQQLKFAETLLKYQDCPTNNNKVVLWFYGPSGSGKTMTAINMTDNNFWITSKNLQWWDGYCGQKIVIIDEFRSDFCTYHELLRILDRYPYRCMTKGSSCWLTADIIIITSCYHPSQVYKGITEEKKQLLRRITKIVCFGPEVKGNTINFDFLDHI